MEMFHDFIFRHAALCLFFPHCTCSRIPTTMTKTPNASIYFVLTVTSLFHAFMSVFTQPWFHGKPLWSIPCLGLQVPCSPAALLHSLGCITTFVPSVSASYLGPPTWTQCCKTHHPVDCLDRKSCLLPSVCLHCCSTTVLYFSILCSLCHSSKWSSQTLSSLLKSPAATP